jgi:phosphoglycerate dehydrogenase-like enzyme
LDILLLERLVPEALAWLEERHVVQNRVELAGDMSAVRKALYKAAAVVIPRRVPITRELLDFAPLLKVVARIQAGNDNTDLEACRERKIRVIQATTANVRANAEFLLASLLLLYRRGIGATLAGEDHSEIKLGRELHGSTVGIFGLAPTAHTLALSLHALGAKLVGYDPAVHSTAPIWAKLRIQPVTLQEMLSQSDAVSVQVMFASRYQGFIDDKMLEHCKRGQVWVGRIEAAMLDAAQSSFGAKGSPLHQVPNLYLTPKLGSFTHETRVRASWYVVQRVHEALTTPHSGPDAISSVPMLDAQVSGLGPISGPASLDER